MTTTTRRETEIEAAQDVPTITITREFDAPRELVFRAWTDPELLVQWLGPKASRQDGSFPSRSRFRLVNSVGPPLLVTSIAGCHGVRHRSSSPVWLALSGTQVACITSISQVKGYF